MGYIRRREHPGRILLRWILGVIFLLVLFGVLNIVSYGVPNQSFQTVVSFVNQNILFLLLISFIMFFGDLFDAFIFPFNLAYPVFNAVGGVLIVVFIYRVFSLIDSLVVGNPLKVMFAFYLAATIIVFVIVLIVGYVNIFVRLFSHRKRVERRHPEKETEEERKATKKESKTRERRKKEKS